MQSLSDEKWGSPRGGPTPPPLDRVLSPNHTARQLPQTCQLYGQAVGAAPPLFPRCRLRRVSNPRPPPRTARNQAWTSSRTEQGTDRSHSLPQRMHLLPPPASEPTLGLHLVSR